MVELKQILQFLTQNANGINLMVDVFLGVATLILTIVNLRLVHRQKEISKEMTELEKDRDQPIFQITSSYERDSNDNVYGTQSISVANVGNHTIGPCEVNVDVYIKLTRTIDGRHDSVYALIGDYFSISYRGNTKEEVFHSITPSNNRIFGEIYTDAVNEPKGKGKIVYYFVDKVLLLKINYTDIHNKEHEKYYMFNKEIAKEEYDRIHHESDERGLFFTLTDISYAMLKEAIGKKLFK